MSTDAKSDAAAKKPPAEPELLLVLLSAGMTASELTAAIEGLKSSSKSVGNHKRRELFWQAYGAMVAKTSGLKGQAYCVMLYRAVPGEDEGEVELIELTKRQRGLVGGGCDIMGHKIKSLDADGKPDPASKSWCMAFSEEDAQAAYDDLLGGEPCIYLAPDGVYVATRFKRVMCKGLSAPLKAVKDIEALVGDLAPDKPLKSISFVGNDPPSVSSYNTFLVGPSKLDKELPASLGHVNTTSSTEIYDYFLQRRNRALVADADKLLAQMLADVGKGLVAQVYAASQKDCVAAYKNALMKRVYAHEST